MKSFLTLSPEERAAYFTEAAARDGRFAAMIYEKDFWICWTLKKLFELPTLGKHLTFKGGTSLSKIYNVINRFSEDIDVSIHRSYFGYDGEKDPENANSANERNKRLEELSAASASLIKKVLLPELESLFKKELSGDWKLKIEEKDSQTILFYYPTSSQTDPNDYIKSFVRIEFGARSDNWPQESGKIEPYMASIFPEELRDIASGDIRVLTKGRTFWEKATILHSEFYRPETSVLPLRHSRHFYDLYCLSTEEDSDGIISDIKLLERVVQHKKVFFRSGWSNYDSAVVGSLKLSPKENQIERLKFDYTAMQPMFFIEPPALDEILSGLSKIEGKINSK